MAAEYHKYLYDTVNRKIIGDFDGAYENCAGTWANQRDVDRIKCRLVEHLTQESEPGIKILDIGCGYGDYVAHLNKQGFDAAGCDVSRYAIEQGRKRNPGIKLDVDDIKNGLHYNDESFDVILLWGVFWFILENVDFCLEEISRILTPKGLFVPSVNIPENPIGKEIMSGYTDFVEIVRRHFHVYDAVTVYTRQDLEEHKPFGDWNEEMVLFCNKCRIGKE